MKEVKVSLWTKGEHLVSLQCHISLSLTECRLSISLKQLISGIFRLWLCSCLLFPFSHPFTLSSIILFSRCPSIQTLGNCFPVWFFPLLFASPSPSNFFYHITGMHFDLIPFFLSLTDLVSGWVLSGFPGDELLSWMWIRPEALVLLRQTAKQTVLTSCRGWAIVNDKKPLKMWG